jgi:hypothetical protein
MTSRRRDSLLGGWDDARELVVARGGDGDVLRQVWAAAQEEADLAYGDWREHHGRECYALYRAAADRADAALDALIAQGTAAA